MKPDIEEFKRRLAGWFAYHNLGNLEDRWSEPDESCPEWVDAVLNIEEDGVLFLCLNCLNDDGDETLVSQFDALADKCGVVAERYDDCVFWIRVSKE